MVAQQASALNSGQAPPSSRLAEKFHKSKIIVYQDASTNGSARFGARVIWRTLSRYGLNNIYNVDIRAIRILFRFQKRPFHRFGMPNQGNRPIGYFPLVHPPELAFSFLPEETDPRSTRITTVRFGRSAGFTDASVKEIRHEFCNP
jgi:hypothetical protein